MIICPSCGSDKSFRDGTRQTHSRGLIQRFLCRSCGYRFSESQIKINVVDQGRSFDSSSNLTKTIISNGDFSIKKVMDDSSFTLSKDVTSHNITDVGKNLNKFSSYNSKRQVCVEETKNLSATTEIKTVAGVIGKSKPLPQEAKGHLTKYKAYLEREGYDSETRYPQFLETLARRGANLLNPEDVKTVIARQNCKDSSKMLACHAYALFAKMEGIQWTMPHYRQNEANIILPQKESTFDELIGFTQSKRMRAFLVTLRETFADPSEILGLEWKDLRDDAIVINKPCKGHLPGIQPVTPRCIAMLRALPRIDEKRIFPVTYRNIYMCFHHMRKRAVKFLHNDDILNITFKTFRHWAGTEIAYRTNGNGLLTIKKALRHKEIKSTMKYIHAIPDMKEIEYETATATTQEEILALGKAGYEKYDEANGIHYYRRLPRKTLSVKSK